MNVLDGRPDTRVIGDSTFTCCLPINLERYS